MKTVWIIKGMSSQPYEYNTWICSVFDSEEKALIHVQELEAEEFAEDYIYMIHEWEVK
ncbi:hypothetical protein [Pseudomonas phage vB_PsaM_M1]|nr:hypothetical protein [Pseudomonas phage vB_PsaM_M1]